MTDKWKVVEKYYTYSKRKGAYSKTVTLLKDASFDECIAFVNKNMDKPFEFKEVKKNVFEARKSGLLYPGTITIKK